MKDYSNKEINFDRISLKETFLLLEIIKESKENEYRLLQRKIRSAVSDSEDILTFLIQSELVKSKDGVLNLGKKLLTSAENELKKVILSAFFEKKLEKHQNIKDFFNLLVFADEKYWYAPDQKLRLKISGIRNFLIELDFLAYEAKTDRYYVTEYGEKFLTFDRVNAYTPTQLMKNLEKIRLLGEKAEKIILKNEKIKLKNFPEQLKEVRHISTKHVDAGYDIKSFSVKNNNSEISGPMYIEVKAVSMVDKKFYWSNNEIATSKMLGDRYYLYLLPVKSDLDFDIKEIIVIQNPYEKVFKNKSEWTSKIELMSFFVDENHL